VDGRDVGQTPVLGLEVEPGERRLRLERAGFRPVEAVVAARKGSDAAVTRGLAALDPADAAALRELAAATGVPTTEVDLERAPPAAGPSEVVVLSPRGASRGPPERVRFHARDAGPAYVVEVQADESGKPLTLWRGSAPPAAGDRAVELPEALRARLAPATGYRVLVSAEGGGAPLARSDARVLSADDLGRVERALAALSVFEADDPAAEFLRVEALLRERLLDEALERAAALSERLPARREPARLVLAVLERAGLRGEAGWAEWAEAHARGR
jgi:hypothetical protein